MSPDTVVHRLGPATAAGFALKPVETVLVPPGVSVLVGGTADDAMRAMRAVYPRSKKWQTAGAVGSATVAMIRAAGFDVIDDPTPNFSNHARLVHPLGAAGFTDENLTALASAFIEVVT